MLHMIPETCINKDIHPANQSNLLTILNSPIKCQPDSDISAILAKKKPLYPEERTVAFPPYMKEMYTTGNHLSSKGLTNTTIPKASIEFCPK